ncbi:MAG: rhamnulose-1-phosphate aldolase, partial [Bacteroidales bacterium]|nr:rhamnulose-1-phosphate aldolase [Bacteroidales bacterium]
DLDDYNSFDLPKSYQELAGMYFIITGTGKRMRDLAKNPLKNALIIKLNENGSAYWIISHNKQSQDFLPSSELPTHLSVHQKIKQSASEKKVVMHTHTNELIALTQIKEYCNQENLNKILFGMHPETIIFVPKGVGFVEYTMPGTEAIAEKTVNTFEKHDVVIWEKHGVFAIGESVSETFDVIDILAKSASIFFMCKSAGYVPEGLSEKELVQLRNAYNLP